MTATYSDDLTNPVHIIRHRIGDVDVPANAQMSDEEITYEYALSGSDADAAAVACCLRLRARYAVLADSTEGDVSKKWSQLFTHFGELAEELAAPAGGVAAVSAPAFGGGISVSDAEARELNVDRTPNAFGSRLGGRGDAWKWGR